MKELLQKSIDQLRIHVLENLENMRENEVEIRELLNLPVSPSRTKALSLKYEKSRKLLVENNDFINMQLSLLNFINKYKHVGGVKSQAVPVESALQAVSMNREECFQKTVEGGIEFGPLHPFYNDDDFVSLLITHFEQNENYEKCDMIMKMRK